MWNFIGTPIGVIITSLIISVSCLLIYHNIVKVNGNTKTKRKSKDLLKWVKVNYTILRKLLKFIWFLIVFITVFFLVYTDYGSNDFIDFSNISRSDVLFLVAIVFSFLPLFTNYKIKTPFLVANSGEEIVEETKKETQVATSKFESQIEDLIDDTKKEADVATLKFEKDIINELKLNSEKLLPNSESEQKGGDLDV